MAPNIMMASHATTGLMRIESHIGSVDQRHKGMANIALTMLKKTSGTSELPMDFSRETGFAAYLNVS